MWILRRIRWKYYDIKNFIKNIWHYRQFLSSDWKWENDSIITVIKLKLQKTVKHYEDGLYLPYIGWREDLPQIQKAYRLACLLDDLYRKETIYLSEDEYKTMIKELFDILENYRKWWD